MRWKRTAVLTAATVTLLGTPVAAATGTLSGFSDVPSSSPHAEAVDWMAEHGISRGCAPERYCPDDAVGRGHLATFLKRLSAAGVVDAGTVQGFSAVDLRGQSGPVGATGVAGATGLPGPAGPQGATGPRGLAGPAGSAGVPGAAGEPGADGSTWLSGAGAPSAELGQDGDLYLDTATHTAYGPRTEGAWGDGTSLKAPALATTVETVTGSWVMLGFTEATSTATCPQGQRVIAGGNELQRRGGGPLDNFTLRYMTVTHDRPGSDGTSWVTGGMDDAMMTEIRAYALCGA